MRPLRSGPCETHFLFLGSDKCRCCSPQPGSCSSGGLSLTLAVSGNSCHGCPVKRLSKARPKPAVRLLHSAGAFICATCVAGSAQPLGRKGLEYGGCECTLKVSDPSSCCLLAHCWSWESGPAAFSLQDMKLLSLHLFSVSPYV